MANVCWRKDRRHLVISSPNRITSSFLQYAACTYWQESARWNLSVIFFIYVSDVFDNDASVQLIFFYSALKEVGQYVDFLFVKFYNNFCNTGDPSSFRAALDKWLSFAQSKIRPLVFVGLPAHALASMSPTHYRKPRELQVIYEVCPFKVIHGRLQKKNIIAFLGEYNDCIILVYQALLPV